MARWRLKEKHYINVPGTEWQHTEQSQQTGKVGRKVYAVPRFLDPNDPADWTEFSLDSRGQPVDGRIVVAYPDGKENPRDIIFEGDPTPDMEPLDDAAKKISASFAGRWRHPIDTLPSNYSQAILNDIEGMVQETMSRPNQALPSVSTQEFDQLKSQVAELLAQNAKLIEQLGSKPTRRV